MKKRHPPRVRGDHGDLHLRQHLHDPQHRDERRHPRRRLLATATRSTRASRRSSTPAAASPASSSGTARRRPASNPSLTTAGALRPRRSPCFAGLRRRRDSPQQERADRASTRTAPTALLDAVRPLLDEHARARAPLAEPGLHSDPVLAQEARPPLRRARPARRGASRAGGLRGRPRRRPRARSRRRGLRRRGPALIEQAARGRADERLRGPARPARPGRRPRRHPRGQGGGGRRGVGAVRGRPAADVPAVRRAAGLADRGSRRHGVRPRRLQGRRGRGEGPGHARARARGCTPGSSSRAASTASSACR